MPVFYATLDPKGILSGAVEGERAVKRLGNSFDDMQGKGVKASSSVEKSLAGLTKTVLGLVGAYKALDAAASFVGSGIAANAGLQDAAVGLAAVLASTHDIYDAQGRALAGQEKFNEALRQSEVIAKQVDLATKTTVATELQLLQAVQATMGAFSQQGVSQAEGITFLSGVANAMSAFQLDLNNLSREAYTLLSGRNLNQSSLFQRIKNLGVAESDIQSWIKAGTVVDNLSQKIGAFSAAGDAMAATYSGRSRDLESSLAGVAEVITKDLTQSLGEAKTALSELFYDPETFKLTKEIEPLVALGHDIASAFGGAALDSAKALASGLEAISGYVKENRASLDALANVAGSVAGNIDKMVVAYVAWKGVNSIVNGQIGLQMALLRGSIAQFGAMTTAVNTFSGATGAARAALSALGGPWVLGLTAAAAAFYGLMTAQSAAEKTTQDMAFALKGMSEDMRGTAEEAGILTANIRSLSELDAKMKALKLSTSIKDFEQEIANTRIGILSFASDAEKLAGSAIYGLAAQVQAGTMSLEDFKDEAFSIANRVQSSTVNDYLEEMAGKLAKLDQAKAVFDGVTGYLEDLESGAATATDKITALAAAADTVGEALRKMDEAAQPKTLEDAYSIYKKYIDAGDKAKSTATENAQAQARLAVELLKKTAAAEDAAGAMAEMAEMDAKAAGKADLAAQYFKQATAHYANAKRLMADAGALEVKIPEIKIGGGSGGGGLSENRAVEQAQDAYKKALDSAEQLRLKNIELAHSLSGDTLASSIAKVEREYSAQISNLDKDLTDLLRKQAEWQKKGLYTSEVAGFVQQYREQVDLARKELDVQREINVALEKRKSIESALGFSLNEEDRMLEKMGALAAAYDMGAISLEQYQLRLTNVGLEIAKLHQMEGFSTWNEDLSLALGGMVQGYEGVAAGLSNTWGNFFTSFTQGFSNSIGQGIVMSNDLEQSLRNVGQNAIAGLISSLMQLGFQWTVNAAIGQGIAAASSAATVAMGAATGAALTAAYTPAATMASLMSFGANSAPAIAGMTAAFTAASAMSSIGSTMGSFGLGGGSYTSSLAGMGQGMASGGYTGDYPKDKITNFVHGGEYVFSADAVDRLGLPFLEALHRGDAKGFASGGYVGGGQSAAAALYSGSAFGNLAAPSAGRGGSGGGAPFKLIIEQKGTPQTYEVEYVTADEARIIARDEARSVVRSDSPGIVRNTFSSDMTQPNSSIAKSVSRNLKSERRR